MLYYEKGLEIIRRAPPSLCLRLPIITSHYHAHDKISNASPSILHIASDQKLRWELPENKAILAAVDLVSYPGPTLSGGVWEWDYKSGVHMPLDNSEITSFSRYPPFCWASQTLNPKWNSSSLLWVKHFAHSSNNEFCTWIFVFLASK